MQTAYSTSLLQKYNVPAPRYTSYPPVPFWKNNLRPSNWSEAVKKAYSLFGNAEGITLYVHLPYCESLCTYCGCNKHITANHAVELPYIYSVMKEWDAYAKILPFRPKLAGIHLGGGTPTFFSPKSLKLLVMHLTAQSEIIPGAEFSFEGHPNNTTAEHLAALHEVGFNRVSFGIQDFDVSVQKAIHRIQPFEKVAEVTEGARKIGYDSVNFDLIYGLPHQSLASIEDTFQRVATLRPDRIAFYSYAHVPEAFPAQRSFEKHLPNETGKRALYEQGRRLLADMGYLEVGMDHFALPTDPLYLAKASKTLHRNFMGYTTQPSRILIGLGNSAISDVYFAYAQNEKKIAAYKSVVENEESTIAKGHLLTDEDLSIKQLILSLICNHEASWPSGYSPFERTQWLTPLGVFKEEDLLDFDSSGIYIREKGIAFIRNICMTFDPNMQKKKQVSFSKAI
jgi:oxygen-independent coproporphyrinogen-3 oxidase